jgi:hypothetical protein
MSSLKIQKIIFGESNGYHFVTFNSGEHEIPIVEDRHDIDIEVMVPASTNFQDVERIALDKAEKFIKELARAL